MMKFRRRKLFEAAGLAAVVSVTGCSSPEKQPKPGQHFVSRPDLVAPAIDVAYSDNTSPAPVPASSSSGEKEQYYFLAMKDGSPQNGPMIVDQHGKPVWMHPMGHRWAYDLRVQHYQGKPVLTWWRGDTSSVGYGRGDWVLMNDSYQEITTVTTPGVPADFHDMQLQPDGTALLTSFPTVKHDLGDLDGHGQGYVVNNVVHRVDVQTGKVLWKWSALDHVALSDSYVTVSSNKSEHGRSRDHPVDPFHLNAVSEYGDNHVLISMRNTHAAYRVDRHTGKIAWILGGKNSDFKLPNEAKFAWQHDVRAHPDGTLSMFDNESKPKVRDNSRGLRLALNTQDMTVRVVQVLRPPHHRLAASQGNLQVHKDGAMTVGWGAEPYYSGYDKNGNIVFDAKFGDGISYRVWRFPWMGQPKERPKFLLKGQTAYVSWNGATQVRQWRFVAGDSKKTAKEVKTVDQKGFETSHKMPDRTYIAAQALDASGRVLGTAEPGRWP
jgi:hypothetical protein